MQVQSSPSHFSSSHVAPPFFDSFLHSFGGTHFPPSSAHSSDCKHSVGIMQLQSPLQRSGSHSPSTHFSWGMHFPPLSLHSSVLSHSSGFSRTIQPQPSSSSTHPDFSHTPKGTRIPLLAVHASLCVQLFTMQPSPQASHLPSVQNLSGMHPFLHLGPSGPFCPLITWHTRNTTKTLHLKFIFLLNKPTNFRQTTNN